jgi:ferric-dicitrate binding protein FerR (iron transport regulator)
MHDEKNPKQKLEQAIAALRAEEPQADAVRLAGERVWQRLSEHANGSAVHAIDAIQSCEDVRALLGQYQQGKLSPARALLIEDHLHECAACRIEAEHRERSRASLLPWKQSLPQAVAAMWGWRQYAVAATVLIVVGLSSFVLYDRFISAPPGMRARLESVNGTVYRFSADVEHAAQVGEEFAEGDRVRTPSGSHAMVRLRDGSLVEMNQRAEMFVSLTRRDTTIHLERGNIIVQAAKRKTGHLYVAAKDCRVAVTGTVFSVNSGLKGSRVSVIEGEVHVAQAGANEILHSGDQVSTSDSVEKVPVRDEIAWSQNLDKHLALLAEFAKLQNKLETVPLPGLRYQSRLLPLLPADTVLYAGIPNLGEAINQANQLFQQQLNESQVLRDWWQRGRRGEDGPSFEQTIQKVHLLSQYLGDEIVFSVEMSRRHESPLIVAEVRRPGLKEFIQNQLAEKSDDPHHGSLRALDEQELAAARDTKEEPHDLVVLVRSDVVAAAFSVAALQSFDAQLKRGSAGGFAATPFGQRMAEAYQSGAGILFGADLEQIVPTMNMSVHNRESRRAAFDRTGFADAKYLVAERKDISGQTSNHAELTFNGPRQGIASWLAAPAPMSGLDFVTPQAGAVAAFVVKNPAQMLDDVLNIAAAEGPKASQEFARAESELKFRIREDLVGTLGGEATFALDGPLLPTPSWKMIIEVYDPARLQSTLQQLVDDFNEQAAEHSEKGLTLEQVQAEGRTYYSVTSLNPKYPLSFAYTFTDGYILIGASRALLRNAIHARGTGDTLMRSAAFRALLPQDQHANVSALLYQNLAPLIAPIADQLTASQRQSLGVLAAETKPSVVCAYGGQNSVEVVSNSRLFGLDLNTFAITNLLRLTHPGTIGD